MVELPSSHGSKFILFCDLTHLFNKAPSYLVDTYRSKQQYVPPLEQKNNSHVRSFLPVNAPTSHPTNSNEKPFSCMATFTNFSSLLCNAMTSGKLSPRTWLKKRSVDFAEKKRTSQDGKSIPILGVSSKKKLPPRKKT